jgi:hypothetical protein
MKVEKNTSTEHGCPGLAPANVTCVQFNTQQCVLYGPQTQAYVGFKFVQPRSVPASSPSQKMPCTIKVDVQCEANAATYHVGCRQVQLFCEPEPIIDESSTLLAKQVSDMNGTEVAGMTIVSASLS